MTGFRRCCRRVIRRCKTLLFDTRFPKQNLQKMCFMNRLWIFLTQYCYRTEFSTFWNILLAQNIRKIKNPCKELQAIKMTSNNRTTALFPPIVLFKAIFRKPRFHTTPRSNVTQTAWRRWHFTLKKLIKINLFFTAYRSQ